MPQANLAKLIPQEFTFEKRRDEVSFIGHISCYNQNVIDKIEHLIYSDIRTDVLQEKESRTWKEMRN